MGAANRYPPAGKNKLERLSRKMMKRICLSILIAIFGVFAGAALVGFDLIPASVGLSVWGLGFIAAVVYFIRSGSKS